MDAQTLRRQPMKSSATGMMMAVVIVLLAATQSCAPRQAEITAESIKPQGKGSGRQRDGATRRR